MRFAHINAGSQADKAVLGQVREGSISQGNQFGEGFTGRWPVSAAFLYFGGVGIHRK